MTGEPQTVALVRAHVPAFNTRDLVGPLDGLCLDVVWESGADTIVGRAEVGALMAAAFEGLGPSLEIRSVVSGDAAAAVEIVERYRYQGVDKVAAIAAFFAFDGPLISRVKLY